MNKAIKIYVNGKLSKDNMYFKKNQKVCSERCAQNKFLDVANRIF